MVQNSNSSQSRMVEKNINQLYLDFDEYIRQGEPDTRKKAGYWQTAIGLQAVDGLTTSDYLKATARKHIEGDIDIDEAREKESRRMLEEAFKGIGYNIE